jgi:hypothetical protein
VSIAIAHLETKIGVDVRRGDTLQIQGGLGAARDRDFGVGPEIDLAVPAALGRLTLRYTHDIAGQTRPLGGLLIVGWAARLWRGSN